VERTGVPLFGQGLADADGSVGRSLEDLADASAEGGLEVGVAGLGNLIGDEPGVAGEFDHDINHDGGVCSGAPADDGHRLFGFGAIDRGVRRCHEPAG